MSTAEMAEIVGILAASGQFLEQSIKIISISRKLYQNIQETPKDVQAWRQEIEHLQQLVITIEESPALQVDELKPILDQCQATSDALLEILGQIDFNKTDSVGRKTWKAVGGLTREAEIQDLFGQIERLKSTLSARIAVLNLLVYFLLCTVLSSFSICSSNVVVQGFKTAMSSRSSVHDWRT